MEDVKPNLFSTENKKDIKLIEIKVRRNLDYTSGNQTFPRYKNTSRRSHVAALWCSSLKLNIQKEPETYLKIQKGIRSLNHCLFNHPHGLMI